MKVKVGDITTSCLGKMLDAEKNQGEYEPYLANLNVRWGSFELDNLQMMRFKPEEQERYEVLNGDLIMCEGGEPGRCAIWRSELPNMKIQKALHRIRAKEGTDIGYLYYWFLFAGKNHLIDGYFTGSTIKHLPGDKLKLIEIELPDYESQKRISSVLSSLDEKIANNNAICSNLEAVAKLLYDYWFVQFDFPDKNGKPYKSSGGKMVWNEELKREIPVGWNVGTLYDISNVVWGQCPDGKDILDRDTVEQNTLDYCSGAGDMRGGFIVDCQAKTYTNTSRRMAHKGAVLMSVAGSIGAMCIADHDISLGRAAVAFESCSEKHNMFIFNVLVMLAQQVQRIATGSIQKVINSDHLDSMKFAYNQTILDLYGEKTFSIYNHLLNEAFENQQLASLRNFLLPMLMNGQVKVGKVGA